MKNAVIKHLEQIADLLEFKNENHFKINAFRNAARIIGKLQDDIIAAVESGELKKTKGIGNSIYNTVLQFISDGTSPVFQELIETIPVTIFDLLEVRGLGPKKVALLFNELHVQNFTQLAEALHNGTLKTLKGFSDVLVSQIESELQRIALAKNYIYIHQACDLSEHILSIITGCPSVTRVHESGQMLLIREIYSALDFTLLVESQTVFLEHFAKHFHFILHDDSSLTINELEIPIHLHITITNSAFVQAIVDNTIPHQLEERYQKLKNTFTGLDSFPFPFFETDFFVIDEKQIPRSPSRVQRENLQGMFHFHTTWSDGLNSLDDMIKAGKDYGYKYFAVCDHSRTATYANGLSKERVIHQRDEIRHVASNCGVTVLSGIESDILTDGSLDYDEDFIHSFDVIVASVHSGFNLPKAEMTARIIKAVEHPKVNILGHPTGRLLLKRDGFDVDMKKVIDACAANKTAIEINSNPLRLDLDWRWLPYASSKDCLFAINADAHTQDSIQFVQYGIMIAKKGGLQEEQIINYFTEEQFLKFIKAK